MGIEDLNIDSDDACDQLLLVTPVESNRETILSILGKRKYAVSVIGNPKDLKAVAQSKPFDIVIVDGPFSGVEAAHTLNNLRSDVRVGRAPIIVFSAQAEQHASKASSSNTHFLPTPIDPSSLLTKLSACLRLRKLRTEQARFESNLAGQNAELRDLTNRFKRELKEARDIQTSLLPKTLPADSRVAFASVFIPLEAVAGDLFDIWKLDHDMFGMFVGDVSGHGLSAAFIGAMTKMALSYSRAETPAQMLADMNTGLCPLIPDGKFVTALVAFYNASNGELKMARAGHPPAFLCRNSKHSVEILRPRGLPLGASESAQFEEINVVLEPGDKLYTLTDGLTEALSMDGSMFGNDGMTALLPTVSVGTTIDQAVENALESHDQFRRGRKPKDDLTLLGLERIR